MRFFKHLFADVTEIPLYFEKEHIPSLNGFRAVSVIIVVIFHLGLSDSKLYQIVFNGSLGVNVFFVISGFLITTILLKEKAYTGTISWKFFYLRRTLRILPAAYLLILIVAILNYFFHLHISYMYLLAALLFVVNFEYFAPYKTPMVSHYWSLSVEEQYYILFPFILKKNFKVFMLFIIGIVFCLPVLITLQYYFPLINRGVFYGVTHFFIKFQGIAVGCLFSVLCLKNIIKENYLKKFSFTLKVVLSIAIFSLRHTGDLNIISVYTNLIISILIGWLLVLNLFYIDDSFFKFLNFKYISKIGVLSYSIYVWHLLVLNLNILPSSLRTFPLCIVIIMLVAWISYNYWEKPFLRLKQRYSVIKDRV